jgi:hypothetical protein
MTAASSRWVRFIFYLAKAENRSYLSKSPSDIACRYRFDRQSRWSSATSNHSVGSRRVSAVETQPPKGWSVAKN